MGNGNKTHKNMKWRLALRIAKSPSERWLMKAAEWNPELSSKSRTEDETENRTESSSHGSTQQKDRGRWTLLEEKYTMTSEERQEHNARTRIRRNSQSRPARYVNGVRLSDEEVANIT